MKNEPAAPLQQKDDGHGHHHVDHILHYPPSGEVPGLPRISATLYNQDLAPTKREGRHWTSYSIFALWANDVHSLGNYGFILGLFALGLGAWQVLLALAIGATLLFFLLTYSGFMGHKTGVPFPVMSRIAFGIRGAQLPAAIRGAVAVVWFGIQTYLATLVLRVMVIAVDPGLGRLDHNSFLGLSTLGWISFIVLWIIQVVIVRYGMDMIRKYEVFAGPVVLFTLIALAVWMFFQAGMSISFSTNKPLAGGAMWRSIFGGAALWVTIYGTFVLNFCDFTRASKSRGSIVRGNLWGIPVNTMLFGIIAVVMAGAQFKINGHIITSPSDVVEAIPNTVLVLLASLALLVLTIAVNMMANFVAPVYALNNFFPKHLNFARASLISAVIGLVILPWNLYNNPVVILYFLGGLGALLGPLFGIIMVDYWLIRKAQVNVPALYTLQDSSPYFYQQGVNPRAIVAFVPAAVISIVFGLVPFFHNIADFSWFFGAGIAAVLYYFLAGRNRRFEDVSGEPIAVASTH
ncbi:NCS1 family nucleobase:cation symporter-1 [Arthrobacter silviterrae]|uniref:NCS1 family nucleobase:cation symporter-1 n=1 Tax=Arthrobacter silviterrae TaxID=2026658 RepID=A0ABX0D7V0_9MICC|nr:NCS1 family nucleobase:cation symporter-1 [Arthrobacter silviterrae]MDQ0276922.1 NCS1 family nucleobase:cation symporter-1 [Arthrobacter silviterrae]NGN82711.1 NCS1 family nucleobase:cation symporter-1 [Arthrobacter silviterrae]